MATSNLAPSATGCVTWGSAIGVDVVAVIVSDVSISGDIRADRQAPDITAVKRLKMIGMSILLCFMQTFPLKNEFLIKASHDLRKNLHSTFIPRKGAANFLSRPLYLAL